MKTKKEIFQQLVKILRPVKYRNFLTYCWLYSEQIEEYFKENDLSFEISKLETKNGQTALISK